ncbi:hypothetical protein [Paraburkholderia sp. BCC1886]|uniref:hypothetical protein n=1 Tax=Paraburkholderia sp. BCC1886 TaxID=2562670 RepID=UPI0011837770|nr:hypothetical protein [Paraburkholderia sp. BCC1886]
MIQTLLREFALQDTSVQDDSQRLVVSAAVEGSTGETSKEQIRSLFHSPVGVYVSHVRRERDCLRLEFDIAASDLDFTLRTLHAVLPEAAIDAVRRRVFQHQKH